MDYQTQTQIYLAMHSGELDYALAETSAPSVYAAMIIIALFVIIRILWGVFKHFFVEEDK